jgi:hypothetical protein
VTLTEGQSCARPDLLEVTKRVVVDDAGRLYDPDTLSDFWRELCGAAKVRQIRLHDARYSRAGIMHAPGYVEPPVRIELFTRNRVLAVQTHHVRSPEMTATAGRFATGKSVALRVPGDPRTSRQPAASVLGNSGLPVRARRDHHPHRLVKPFAVKAFLSCGLNPGSRPPQRAPGKAWRSVHLWNRLAACCEARWQGRLRH